MIGTPKIEDVAEPASDFNMKIIEEFRANGGKVGGRWAGGNLLLLHHTGAKSGTERVNPVTYQRVGAGFAVFATKAGAPVNPDPPARGRSPLLFLSLFNYIRHG